MRGGRAEREGAETNWRELSIHKLHQMKIAIEQDTGKMKIPTCSTHINMIHEDYIYLDWNVLDISYFKWPCTYRDITHSTKIFGYGYYSSYYTLWLTVNIRDLGTPT